MFAVLCNNQRKLYTRHLAVLALKQCGVRERSLRRECSVVRRCRNAIDGDGRHFGRLRVGVTRYQGIGRNTTRGLPGKLRDNSTTLQPGFQHKGALCVTVLLRNGDTRSANMESTFSASRKRKPESTQKKQQRGLVLFSFLASRTMYEVLHSLFDGGFLAGERLKKCIP